MRYLMRHLISSIALIFLLSTSVYAGDTINPHTGNLQKITDFQTEDGATIVYAPETIKVPNGSLTDNLDGTASLDFWSSIGASLIPSAADTYNIGSVLYPWLDAYFNDFTLLGNDPHGWWIDTDINKGFGYHYDDSATYKLGFWGGDWDGADLNVTNDGFPYWYIADHGGDIVFPHNVVHFGLFPITPSSAPTTNYQVANKKYVDDNIGAPGEDSVGTTELDDGADTPAVDDVVVVDPADTTQFKYIGLPDSDGAGKKLVYDDTAHAFSAVNETDPTVDTQAEIETILGYGAVTLAADADVLLGISTQELNLDTQTANTIFAGPAAGAAADPTFRALVDNDIPNNITITETDPNAIKVGNAIIVETGTVYATITLAMAAAAVGDTILVAEGSYDEAVTFSQDDLTLKAWGSAENTTITQAAGTTLTFSTKSGCVLDGFTVALTAATASADRVIYSNNDDASDYNIVKNCTITETHAGGSTIIVLPIEVDDGNIRFENIDVVTTQTNASASYAFDCRGAHTHYFEDVRLTMSHASGGAQAGWGLHSDASTLAYFKNCTIDIDSNHTAAGTFYALYASATTNHIIGCPDINAVTTGTGAMDAIYVDGTTSYVDGNVVYATTGDSDAQWGNFAGGNIYVTANIATGDAAMGTGGTVYMAANNVLGASMFGNGTNYVQWNPTGNMAFVGTARLMLPVSADPDIATEGMISWDSDDDAQRGHDGTNQVVVGQKKKFLNWHIENPDDLETGTGRADKWAFIWHNDTGFIATITEIEAWSDSDNYDFDIFETNGKTDFSLANDTLVDTLECETDSTGIYTDTETPGDGTIENDDCILFVHKDGTTGKVGVRITLWLNADIP